jgi:hypothetical protein
MQSWKGLGEGGATQQPLRGKLGTAQPWKNHEQAETDSLTMKQAHF